MASDEQFTPYVDAQIQARVVKVGSMEIVLYDHIQGRFHVKSRSGRPIAYLAPPVAHALHDDDVDADSVNGDLAEAVHDGLTVEPGAEPEPALPLGCRWRVPLT